MAQTAPSPDKTSNQTPLGNLTPPDEQFWQHYSPHGEFPLSSVGSLVLHLLVFGLMALLAWLGVALFSHSSKSLPVEAVRLDLGGGGGNPRGRGDGPNNGPAPVESGNQGNDTAAEKVPDAPPPEIKVNPDTPDKPKFDDPSKRRIQIDESKASSAFESLRKGASKIQPPGNPPSSRGGGGKGEGGGSGDGKGTGVGSGTGDGPGNLTKREKRQLRWTLLFKTLDNNDYVSQLQGLGAVLAIPVRERGEDFEYAIVRNLSARPAKVSVENIEDVLREVSGMVRWVDDNPRTAAGVIAALGLPMPGIAPQKLHFVACMPARTEEKLLKLELAHLHRKYPNLDEDDIYSTKFRLNARGEPEVSEQKLKNK